MDNRSPRLTVDVIIELRDGIVLVERKYEPHGWAIPGGFVEYGETVEEAARREVREETSLDIEELHQFRVYSDPSRDPRGHTVSVVFIAKGVGTPEASSDAKKVGVFRSDGLPSEIAFDHREILMDYARSLRSGSP
jgi:ADP-ribose pyrophosphatase YjhB (NUDIX family)